MTELPRPIVGPLLLSMPAEPRAHSLSFDLGAGAEFLIPTSLTEDGSGYQFHGAIYKNPNRRDMFGLGLELNLGKTNGNLYEPDQQHTRLLLNLNRGIKKEGETVTTITSQNLYTGVGRAAGHTTLELGSDIYSQTFFWKMSGNTGLALRPYLGTLSSIPLELEAGQEEALSEAKKEISLVTLRAGIDLRLLSLDNSTLPPLEGLTDTDLAFYLFASAHRFGRTYGMGKAVNRPANKAQEYIEQLDEGEGLPSAKMEDVGFFKIVDLYGAGNEDGSELNLQLKANGDQAPWMAASKIIFSGGYFFLKAPMQGFAGGLELLHWGMAKGYDLDLSSRRTQSSKTKKENARNFLLTRSLVNALAFGIGWGTQSEKMGRGLLQGGQEAMMATALNPDPAETRSVESNSTHIVYEWTNRNGNYLGLEQTTDIPSSHLYTGVRLLVQAVPGSDYVQDEVLDDATGRDPLYQGAKAKAAASLGLQAEIGPLVLQGGALTLLAYGDSSKPSPGIGLEQKALLSLEISKKVHVDLGVGISESLINGELELGLSPVAGLRLASF